MPYFESGIPVWLDILAVRSLTPFLHTLIAENGTHEGDRPKAIGSEIMTSHMSTVDKRLPDFVFINEL